MTQLQDKTYLETSLTTAERLESLLSQMTLAEKIGQMAQVEKNSIAHATANELLATNVHWNFAPALSVPQDFCSGRTYEGYSENTALVSQLDTAYVRGLQSAQPNGERVLASITQGWRDHLGLP